MGSLSGLTDQQAAISPYLLKSLKQFLTRLNS